MVKKDNVLINAAYTLTLAEQRLILLAVADAAGQPDVLKDMTVYAEQYANRFKVTRQAAYIALGEASKQLFERRFSYERISSKGRPRQVVSRWIQRIEYGESEGLVKLRFADDVIPLLTDLQNRFTYYALEQVSCLTSVHAVRLYEMLIAWRSTGKTPVFEVADFRQQLGIEPDEYLRMEAFKRRVLDLAIKQINEHTDIKVSYEQHKKGRRIAAFSFTFTVRNERDPNTIDMLTGKSDKESWPKKRKKISRKEAEQMAYPGEEWSDLLARIGTEYLVDLNTPSDDGAP